MRRKGYWGLLAMMAALATSAAAQDEMTQPVEAPSNWTVTGVGEMRYVYHLDNPEPFGTLNPLGNPIPGYAYDADLDNTFFVTQRLSIEGNISESSEAKVTLTFGEDAISNSPGGSGLGGLGVAFEEAWFKHQINDTLAVRLGKLLSFQGWEVIDPLGNTQISRGLLFTNLENITQTGVFLDAAVNDQVDVTVGLINGWDQAVDINSEKTIVVRTDIDTGPMFAGGVNVYYGSETTVEANDRLAIDATFSSEISEQFSVAYQLMYLSEDIPTAGPGSDTESGTAFGIGLWPTLQVDKWQVGARIEYVDFNDVLSGTADGVSLIDVAITPGYQVSDNFAVRAEVRLTTASEDFFTDEDGDATDSNTSLAANAIWKF